jgi:hypothetical protein
MQKHSEAIAQALDKAVFTINVPVKIDGKDYVIKYQKRSWSAIELNKEFADAKSLLYAKWEREINSLIASIMLSGLDEATQSKLLKLAGLS